MYKAKLASPSAQAWWHSGANAVTYSVHERTCMLLNDEGKLLSVVTPEIGPGPFSVVIQADSDSPQQDDSPFSNVHVGAPVSMSENMINIDSVLIDAKDAVTWAPRLAWEKIDSSKFHESYPELRRFLILHGAPGSLSALVGNGVLDSAQAQLLGSWQRISEALRKHDLASVQAEIGRIAGLGIGLTPAGDDFLVGVMMAIWFFSAVPVAKKLAMDIRSAVSGKTTMLSQAYISAASEGEATYRWHVLIDIIATGNKSSLRQAAIQLIKTGSTSGSDALSGFLLAAEVLDKNPLISNTHQ